MTMTNILDQGRIRFPVSRTFGALTIAMAVAAGARPLPAQTVELPNGFCAEVLADSSEFTSIRGLAASGDGRLFVSDNSWPARLAAVDVETGVVSTVLSAAPLYIVAQLLIGNGTPLVGTDLILADWNTMITSACCNGAVLRIDPDDGSYSILATGNPTFAPPGDPYGLALAPGGLFGTDLFVMDFQGASPNPPVLYKIHQAGGMSTFLVSPAVWTTARDPAVMAFDPGASFGGDLFILDGSNAGGPPAIWRVTPAAVLSAFVQGPLSSPGGLAFGLGGVFGTDMYVLDVGAGPAGSTLYRIDPSGVLTVFATGLPAGTTTSKPPSDITFSPDGLTLYVAIEDTILSIEPGTVWTSYCTAGTSASACQATLAACGSASATAASGFTLSASSVEGGKDGLFFSGTNGPQANPWGNGTSFQCVTPPVKRLGIQVGAGTPGACDGSFSQDLNALWCPTCPKPGKNPGAGTVVQAQLWYRDPQNTSNQTTSLSDALEFTVSP